MERLKNKFAQRLKELRESKKFSQLEIAKEMGYTQVCISRWETGERNPSLDDLIAIAQFFCVSSDYLLGLTDFL